ncbi:MAG: DUF262 domain-containing protein [Roseomonas sp.]|nr:DUF262 domain-containing protein [Roseomonas sp.]MCA3290867.1 DUF262 domain-containing protein [Roseomonas sp.]MCA3296339.1 DUF262 domain-containing protein [Roseomonas sp.]
MEPAERTLGQVLTDQIRYEIPPYQRPYSWEAGNVEQLLDDVWEAFQAKDDEYFSYLNRVGVDLVVVPVCSNEPDEHDAEPAIDFHDQPELIPG